MPDESELEQVAKAVAAIAKEVPIYKDAIQPAAKEIGAALETTARLVNVVLAPVKALVWGYEQFEVFLSSRVAAKLQNTPAEEVVPPPLNVVGPALEALRYVGHDESLRELYANLLASSMDAATVKGAHPGFVEILKQISPDESRLLQLFSLGRAIPIIRVRREQKKPAGSGFDVVPSFSLLGEDAKCEHPDLTPVYLSNLCRLGIIEVPDAFHYTVANVYDSLEKHPQITNLVNSISLDNDVVPRIVRRGAVVTPLGWQFIRACVLPHEDFRSSIGLVYAELNTLLSGGSFATALEVAEAGWRKNPNDLVLQNIRISCIAKTGRFKEALAESQCLIDRGIADVAIKAIDMAELALLSELPEQYAVIRTRYSNVFLVPENVILEIYLEALLAFIQSNISALCAALSKFRGSFSSESVKRYSNWDFTELDNFLSGKPDSTAKDALHFVQTFKSGFDNALLVAAEERLSATQRADS